MPDIALTGVPRGGTTLACKLLGQAANALALFEPIEVERLPADPLTAAAAVEEYFANARTQVLRDRRAPSKHRGGEVPDNPFGDGLPGSARPQLVELGEIAVQQPLTADFHLVIKHNATFMALLPQLAPRMRVIGVVRNPLAVLLSWHSLDLPVARGRLPAGERLDPGLAARLAAEPDLLQRQLGILDWCFERLLRWLPQGRLLRYEDIVADGGDGLLAAAGLQGQPARGLRNRNANPQYDRDRVEGVAAALLRHAGPGLDLYGEARVERLATELAAGTGGRGA